MILKVITWSSKYMYEVSTYFIIFFSYIYIFYIYIVITFFSLDYLQGFEKWQISRIYKIPLLKFMKAIIFLGHIGYQNAPTSYGCRRHYSKKKQIIIAGKFKSYDFLLPSFTWKVWKFNIWCGGSIIVSCLGAYQWSVLFINFFFIWTINFDVAICHCLNVSDNN